MFSSEDQYQLQNDIQYTSKMIDKADKQTNKHTQTFTRRHDGSFQNSS